MSILTKMFGLKKEADILANKRDIIHEPTMKAIQRYTGVAFDHLDYEALNEKEQAYIDSHVILFSNLFGPLRASDLIPEYRLKQGEAVVNAIKHGNGEDPDKSVRVHCKISSRRCWIALDST